MLLLLVAYNKHQVFEHKRRDLSTRRSYCLHIIPRDPGNGFFLFSDVVMEAKAAVFVEVDFSKLYKSTYLKTVLSYTLDTPCPITHTSTCLLR